MMNSVQRFLQLNRVTVNAFVKSAFSPVIPLLYDLLVLPLLFIVFTQINIKMKIHL